MKPIRLSFAQINHSACSVCTTERGCDITLGEYSKEFQVVGRGAVSRSSKLFAESLTIRLFHVKTYEQISTWSIQERAVPHSILWYVKEGGLFLETRGERHEVEAGRLVFLAENVPFTAGVLSSPPVMISINFDAKISYLYGQRWSDHLQVPVVYDYDMSRIRPLVEEMGEAPESAYHALYQTARLYELLALMLEQLNDPSDRAPRFRDARVQLATEYVLSHLGEDVGLQELCELVELSPTHLRRLFVQETGQPPLAFIRQLKMMQARKWLMETNLRVSEIAYRLGFSDQNYFTRMYKKTTGVTPTEDREQFQL